MNIESGTNIKKRIYLMLIFSIFMVIISSSRTSFNVLLMEIVLIILFLLIEKRIKIKYTMIVSIITILIIILLKDVIYDSIISKYIFKSENLLDGRFEVWSMTIKELKLFGHGRDYFINLGLGAHSTYISIMGQYGLLSFIFFTLFFIDILIKTRISNPFKRSYIVWASSSLFLILSFAEGMINSPAMMIALYVFFANNNFSLVGLKIKEKDLNLLKTERITI
ncbi:MAG TPA: hypothetical protein GX708_21730 [Gallicola sp.]|nr:hypothetical protein [Gallicola sp.]